jgi:Leu/Phe-tRNA-protein transferase
MTPTDWLKGYIVENGQFLSVVTFYRPDFLSPSAMIDPELLLQGYRLGVFPMAMEDA